MKRRWSMTTLAAVILIAVGLVAIGIEWIFEPDDGVLFFYLTPIYCWILAAGLLVVSLCRRLNRRISPYLVFGLVDFFIGLCVTIYAFYDIFTDTGWFAGILGTLLLLLVVPATVVFLIVDGILWWRNRLKTKTAEIKKPIAAEALPEENVSDDNNERENSL